MLDHLNDEALRVVVAHPMDETPGLTLSPLTEAGDTAQPLSPLTEADESVVESVFSHVMDSYNVEMPQPPTLPLHLTFHIPPLPLSPIPAPRTPLPQCCSPGVRSTTISYSIGEKYDCHGGKWFEDHYGFKLNTNGPHLFQNWFLNITIGNQLKPG